MREKDLQVKFHNWLRDNKPSGSAVYELKICKGNTMPFSQVKRHQISALLSAKTSGLYHKISDSPVSWGGVRFASKKPFDCMYLRDVDAFVVVLFYRPREAKRVAMIDIDVFVAEQAMSTRKSITRERAFEIADRIIRV